MCKTITLSEENIGEFYDPGLGKGFLGMITNKQTTMSMVAISLCKSLPQKTPMTHKRKKIDNLGFINIKNFYSSKT